MEPDPSLVFERCGFAVCRGALPADVTRLAYEYGLQAALQDDENGGDRQVPGSPAFYDDPLMRVLHLRLTRFIERSTGLELWPTYCYMRHYVGGAALAPHTDRPACEISASVSLGYHAAEPWALHVVDRDERAHRVLLEPGDLLIYRGCELVHWRDRFEGEHQVQVFLHYVDKKGAHASLRDDQRPKGDFRHNLSAAARSWLPEGSA